MKTISELNNKWWYRLIKVVYLTVFSLSFVGYPVAVFLSYGPEYDNDKSYIKCANGKDFILSKNGINLSSNYMYSWDKDKAENLCFDGVIKYESSGASSGLLKEFLKPKVISITNNSGKYELVSRYTSRNYFATIGLSLLSMAITILVFELIRRVFYYVVLGSLKPKKV